MLLTFGKTFYYNFIPSKAEEEAYMATNTPFRPTRTLMEIRDVYLPPVLDLHNPWQIKNVLTPSEAGTGRIRLSCADTFNHVFRYWTMEMTNRVVTAGRKQNVVVWDATDENNPTSYVNEDMYIERGPECEYFFFGCMELIRDRRLISGDEIGLYWDIKTASFQLKVLYRGI